MPENESDFSSDFLASDYLIEVLDYMASGMSKEDIWGLSYLTEEDILACLAFAVDREKWIFYA